MATPMVFRLHLNTHEERPFRIGGLDSINQN
jgi:hypothetical protein